VSAFSGFVTFHGLPVIVVVIAPVIVDVHLNGNAPVDVLDC
jgi:hypothetical protein